MQQLLDFSFVLLLYFLLGFAVALLELCFQHYMTPGMIFNWYAKWLLQFNDDGSYWDRKHSDYYLGLLMNYINKPLGLCPYCNGTWVAIAIFIYYFGFKPEIFLFIGIVWFYIRLLYRKLI